MRNDPSFESFEVAQRPASACLVQSDEPLVFPPIMLDGVPPAEDPAKQNVWEYLIDNINEFEVAKTITDFVEANPKLLTDRKDTVDLLGLHVLAKVSLKRQQVAFKRQQAAEEMAQQATDKAREQSRSIHGRAKSVAGHLLAVARVLRDNPSVLTTMVCVIGLAVSIWTR